MFSLVLPCFNEEGTIAQTVRDVAAWMKKENVQGEIIVVNDGSRDRTPRILEEISKEVLLLRILHFETNHGYGIAIRRGLDEAKGDVLGFMDSDGQFHAEDLGLLLTHIPQTRFVTGYRVHRADPPLRLLNAALFGMLVRLVLRISVRDVNCGMKLFTRDVWEAIRPTFGSGGLFSAELYYRAKIGGIPWVQVPVSHYPRLTGKPTGANPFVIFRAFRDLWRLKR